MDVSAVNKGEDSGAQIISRSVAQDNSKKVFHLNLKAKRIIGISCGLCADIYCGHFIEMR